MPQPPDYLYGYGDAPPGWPVGWADERLGEPVLVLSRPPSVTGLVAIPPWFPIGHQTGGLLCHHHEMLARRLTPRPGVLAGMIELEHRSFASNLGWNRTADEETSYRAHLRELFGPAADRNADFSDLEEAIYPIDLTREALAALTDDEVEIQTDFGLYILGANSD